MLYIINYIRGNITVEITGAAIERFMNVCAARGVAFWNVCRIAPDKIRATVRIEGFYAVRRAAKRCMCEIHVVKKTGLPFKARRLEKRWALWGGLIACAAAVYILSSFVWTVTITGCETMSQLELMAMLERCGLKTGASVASIDSNMIRNTILSESEILSFLAVNIRGTHAEVTVRERIPTPEVIDNDAPCDVVADKAGIIIALRVRAGSARVKVNETIMPGDLLASGTMVSTQGQKWLVHAAAEADIRTWYVNKRAMPEIVFLPRETGEVTVRRALIIGGRRYNLYLIESEPYACYYKTVEKNPLMLGEGFRFPFALVTETYKEVEAVPQTVNTDTASALLERRMDEELASDRPDARVVSRKFSCGAVSGAIIGVMSAECIETAGIERPIGR